MAFLKEMKIVTKYPTYIYGLSSRYARKIKQGEIFTVCDTFVPRYVGIPQVMWDKTRGISSRKNYITITKKRWKQYLVHIDDITLLVSDKKPKNELHKAVTKLIKNNICIEYVQKIADKHNIQLY